MGLRDALQAVMDAYGAAYRARDAARCAEAYAPDACIFSPWAPPARGRDAIVALHRDWMREPEENKRLEVRDVRAQGDLAYCVVAYAADLRQSDGATRPERGSALNVLERMGGTWRIRVSSLTPDSD